MQLSFELAPRSEFVSKGETPLLLSHTKDALAAYAGVCACVVLRR